MDCHSPSLTSWVILAVVVTLVLAKRIFSVPAELRHLPRAPLLPLLASYVMAESETSRIRRLILPFAKSGESLVVVWALGRWTIHILDHTVARSMLENLQDFPKERPPDQLLLWKFVGTSNILMHNGEKWKQHSAILRTPLNQSPPVEQFTMLSRKLFAVMGEGGSLHWDNLAQRFALDAIGTTILGWDFRAISDDAGFVSEYNGVMEAIANPLYLVLPILERLFPRRSVINRIEALVQQFEAVLTMKKQNPGDDMLTMMLREPGMSDVEYRDNIVLLFIAGHDTSAGSISSLVYYLAKYPKVQETARAEILSILNSEEPTVHSLLRLCYLDACIREALRLNTPISYIVPRSTSVTLQLGNHIIPANSSIIANFYSIHHAEENWRDAEAFLPERFMTESHQDAWLPFASGPRQCPARNFALFEQRTLMACLLREFRWKLPENSIHKNEIKNAFSPFALSIPYEMKIEFERIKPGLS